MTRYALIDSDTGLDKGKRAKFEGTPPDESRKGVKWIPFVENNATIEDPLTHRLGKATESWSMTQVTLTRLAVEILQEEQDDRSDREVVKALALDIKNEVGTPQEQLTRMSKVVFRLMKDTYGI